MHEFFVDVVACILLLGIMVVVHEFGHFAVAKLCRVRVEAFSVGFGPRLFGIKHGDTDYKVCALPFGGYVKMTGENPGEEAPTDDPGAFSAHPRWQRMLIGVAGPAANFVLALVAMTFYYAVINEVPKGEIKGTSAEWVIPDSPAANAGIQPGDIIRRFDTVDNPDWAEAETRAAVNQGQTVPVVIERNGKTQQLWLPLPKDTRGQDFSLSVVGLDLQFLSSPIVIQEVSSPSPAAQAGLEPGDAILSLDGHAFHTIFSLLDYLQFKKGGATTLVIQRNGVQSTVTVHPAMIDSAWRLGIKLVDPPTYPNPLPLSKAVGKSVKFCKENSSLILEVVRKLFTHQVSVTQLQGPVSIARMAGMAAETRSWDAPFKLAGVISLNLGILNLLPFPILDGGLILFLLIESVMGREINIAVKERIYQAAFVVLVFFAIFIVFNDVSKIPFFTHLKL